MKIIILAITLMIGATCFSQDVTYKEVSTTTVKLKGRFQNYTAKDVANYNVGEKIQIGLPSTGRSFIFITSIDIS